MKGIEGNELVLLICFNTKDTAARRHQILPQTFPVLHSPAPGPPRLSSSATLEYLSFNLLFLLLLLRLCSLLVNTVVKGDISARVLCQEY